VNNNVKTRRSGAPGGSELGLRTNLDHPLAMAIFVRQSLTACVLVIHLFALLVFCVVIDSLSGWLIRIAVLRLSSSTAIETRPNPGAKGSPNHFIVGNPILNDLNFKEKRDPVTCEVTQDFLLVRRSHVQGYEHRTHVWCLKLELEALRNRKSPTGCEVRSLSTIGLRYERHCSKYSPSVVTKLFNTSSGGGTVDWV